MTELTAIYNQTHSRVTIIPQHYY